MRSKLSATSNKKNGALDKQHRVASSQRYCLMNASQYFDKSKLGILKNKGNTRQDTCEEHHFHPSKLTDIYFLSPGISGKIINPNKRCLLKKKLVVPKFMTKTDSRYDKLDDQILFFNSLAIHLSS